MSGCDQDLGTRTEGRTPGKTPKHETGHGPRATGVRRQTSEREPKSAHGRRRILAAGGGRAGVGHQSRGCRGCRAIVRRTRCEGSKGVLMHVIGIIAIPGQPQGPAVRKLRDSACPGSPLVPLDSLLSLTHQAYARILYLTHLSCYLSDILLWL